MGRLRVFGSTAYVLRPKVLRIHKFAPVSDKGIFVGYSSKSKGWYILCGNKMIVSRDVVFNEIGSTELTRHLQELQ